VKKQIFLSYIFFVLVYQGASAQMIGKPFIRNYSPKLYQASPQNWEMAQDKRGVLYFANDQGILEYDGKNWMLIQMPNQSAVRSMDTHQNGVVYVGASGEFGYLASDSVGKIQYVSLTHLLKTEERKFADVWTTTATTDGIYFLTDYTLYCYQPSTKTFKTWAAPKEAYFFLGFLVGKQLYVHTEKDGLLTLQNGKLQSAPKGKELIDNRVYCMIPFDNEHILMGVREKGLMLYNPTTKDEKKILQKFDNEAQAFLENNQIYYGIRLPDNNFAICTRRGGVVILDKSGKIQQIINTQNGLMDDNVRFAIVSKDNMLWLALNNGISKVNYRSPRYWNESSGLKGNIQDIIQQREGIYIATSQGVFHLIDNQFMPIQGINSTQCWSFLDFNHTNKPENDQLLVGTNDGIYVIQNNQARLLKNTNRKAVLKLYQSHSDPNRVYAGLKGGLLSMYYDTESERWKDEGEINNITDEIYSIAEDEKGNVWLGTFINGLLKTKIDFAKKQADTIRFTQKQGLPSIRNIGVYYFNQRLLFSTLQGLYRWDENNKRFLPDTLLGKHFADASRGIYKMAIDPNQNIWVADIQNQKNAIGAGFLQPNLQYVWYDVPLRILPTFSEPVIYPAPNSIVWIGGSEGLFRYNNQIEINYQQTYHTLIRKVTYGEDSVIFHGSYYESNAQNPHPQNFLIGFKQPQNLMPVFKFSNQFSITFDFVAPYYNEESAMEYSHFLEGYDKNWSSWSKENKKQYTNLSEGYYVFKVKARDVYGQESLVAEYKFRVLPPWYRTVVAYSIYLLLSALLVMLFISIYTKRLRKQKKRLEEIIKERTKEISNKNEELEKSQDELLILAKHLRQANEDITASISYASKIQASMLPPLKGIEDAFPDSFIIYRPRDIVSGDFYWFTETPLEPRFAKDPNIKGTPSILQGFAEGKKIIAAVDCTGHGVPGAFMSMAGDVYLNQIVTLEGITQSHLILKELHENVRKTFRQEETNNTDGMDMALCVINPNNQTLEFSGAKNPLVYIQDGELVYIKGDKNGIGGFQFDDTEKEYTRHVVPLDKPTSFFIFSDGFQDQFGGPKGKKFMISRMKELFLAHKDKPMQAQKLILEKAIDDWMEGFEQIDDILLIGIHINPEDFKIF
jgi:serine phosphatase RsbU (regulator of sigma subunit)/ligand-binding sensor domain-containing protein